MDRGGDRVLFRREFIERHPRRMRPYARRSQLRDQQLLGARRFHEPPFREEQLIEAEEDREHRDERRDAEHAADGEVGGAGALDAREKPRILFNYLSEPDDQIEMRACVRLTREIFAQPAFDRYRGRELQPGSEVQSDEQIDAFIRAKVESAYHPSCSCKMGAADDAMAVVAPDTRVYGLERLRVVDSSIMPQVTTGNLNAPTIMLAEKAADHILGRGMLAPETAPFYSAPNWRTAQR